MRTFLFKVFNLLTLLFIGGSSFAQENPEVHPIMEFFGLGKSPLTTIAPVNALGREVNDLYALTGWVGLLIFLILTVLFIIIIFSFRAKVNPNPKDMHGNFFLEMLWTVIPIIILIIIAVPTIRLIFMIGDMPDLNENKQVVIETSEGRQEYNKYLEINVVGHQWWWEFEYVGMYTRNEGDANPSFTPIHRVTANEPWLPVNVPVKLNITSEDVIHSFWVPRIAGKIDAVPGAINPMTFVVAEARYYFGSCAEYCGASHAMMRFHVNVVPMEDFDKWLNWGQGEPIAVNASAERGKAAVGSCLACHTMNGLRTFEARKEKLDNALAKYEVDKQSYLQDIETWKASLEDQGLQNLWGRELNNMDSKPVPPKIPALYKGEFRTIAPDLTDLRFRKKILAGIKENTTENLLAWIENPSAIKPEIEGTPVIRMPGYKHVFSEKTILDIIEFLQTVEYSNSDNRLSLNN